MDGQSPALELLANMERESVSLCRYNLVEIPDSACMFAASKTSRRMLQMDDIHALVEPSDK